MIKTYSHTTDRFSFFNIARNSSIFYLVSRVQDKVCILISVMFVFLTKSYVDFLLESSHRDNSNKESNKGFGEEITQVVSIKS